MLLQVQEIVKGLSHLFALQVTSLGDGATLIAATWLHALADGTHASLSSRLI